MAMPLKLVNQYAPHCCGMVSFRARHDLLPPQLAWLMELLKVLKCGEGDIDHICLAAEETLLDILNVACSDTPNHWITMGVEHHRARVVVIIHHKGQPFRPLEIPTFNPEQIENNTDGLGYYLASSVTDEIVYHNCGRNGWIITLSKMLASGHVNNINTSVQESHHSTALPQCSDIRTNIRRMKDTDAFAVSRCAYQCYGYGYESYIYYPEQVIERNAKGKLHSLVLATESHEVVGHIALKEFPPSKCIQECGLLFVSPQFRGRGKALELLDAVCTEGRKKAMSGIFTRAVTGHTASQKLSCHRGFTDCALLLEHFPNHVKFKNLTDVLNHKMAAVIQWLTITESQNPQVLYLPERHAPVIEKLYRHMNRSYRIAAHSENQQHIPHHYTEPSAALSKTKILCIADVFVHTPEKFTREHIVFTQNRLLAKGTKTIYLYVALNNPAILNFVTEAEGAGFIFAGILPCALGSNDAIILQYTSNEAPAFDQIHANSETAQILLSHIHSEHKRIREGVR